MSAASSKLAHTTRYHCGKSRVEWPCLNLQLSCNGSCENVIGFQQGCRVWLAQSGHQQQPQFPCHWTNFHCCVDSGGQC